jgi:hypothetical protein
VSREINFYNMQYQSVWRERAHDNRISLVWRLFSLAAGSHRRNGHATFKEDEIAEILGVSPQQVSNLIADAKRLGLIDARSKARCLVVPPHAIIGGQGKANEPCGYCEGKRTGRKPSIFHPQGLQDRRNADTAATTPSSAKKQLGGQPDATATKPLRTGGGVLELVKNLDGCSQCGRPAEYASGLCDEHEHERCVDSWKRSRVGYATNSEMLMRTRANEHLTDDNPAFMLP